MLLELMGNGAKSAPRASISAFIICCNEARQIERCLESIKWCDEIIIVDSGSTDGTLEICRRYTDKILHRAWPGFVAQKRFGLSECTKDWVLNIDADEVVTQELRDEIIDVLETDGSGRKINGYALNRVVFFMGKWWRKGGWYPEYRLRLCRRSATTWGGSDPHEKASVDGTTGVLHGELSHYTYDDLAHQIRSLNSHSSAAAKSLHDKGVRSGLGRLIFRPLGRFFKFYLLRKGFLEGTPGFLVAISETYYVFIKYAKLWELSKKDQ